MANAFANPIPKVFSLTYIRIQVARLYINLYSQSDIHFEKDQVCERSDRARSTYSIAAAHADQHLELLSSKCDDRVNAIYLQTSLVYAAQPDLTIV